MLFLNIIFWTLTGLTCGLAVWKGGDAERFGGALILTFAVIWEATGFLSDDIRPTLQLVFDFLTALGLLAIAVRYASLWLGGVLMFQALQFCLHSFYVVTKKPHDNLHAVVNNGVFLAILTCLLVGTLVAWRRRSAAKAAALS
ncbi:hypothetical protein [Phenylobacterium sp.]|uniref:hypothetical protein n=1 Tax=Phenylobacterium sp. TaxID=1871053 RepID=UPI00286D23A1|nr:hypothetical protein [Phenylobacterium sp.]